MLDERLPLVGLYALRVNRKFLRRPASIVFSALQPLTWLVLIGWVLDRSGARVGDVDYLTFFVPTAVTMTAMYTSFQGGIGTAMEIEAGFVKRLVFSGAKPVELLLGRWLSDLMKGLGQMAILVLLALALGASVALRPDHILGLVVAALGLMVFGLGVSNWIAVVTRHSEHTFALAVVVIPVTLLVSEAFAPRGRLPQPVGALTWLNPAAYGLKALRSAIEGGVATPYVTGFVLTAIGLLLLWTMARSQPVAGLTARAR